MPRLRPLAPLGALLALTGAAHAQVVINEVFVNPPNGGDDGWEFIELYGPPNYDLSGYTVAYANDDGVREFDEVFTLEGVSTDANGFVVLHNGRDALKFFPTMVENPGFVPIFQVSPTNLPFVNGYPFSLAHVPSSDTPGKLNNEGSATFILARQRPGFTLSTTGQDLYLGSETQFGGFAWRKDALIDRDDDSALDFGDEPGSGPISTVEPAQFVDEISWSNAGGREYNRQGRGIRRNKISETPGFNPDSVVRVRYLNENPLAGFTVDDGEPEPTSNGDESWFYGENLNVNPGTSDYGLFKDFFEGMERTFGGPTDPNGPLFSFTGAGGQQNPLEFPFFENTNTFDPINGDKLFKPYDITGLRLTPGGFNDAEGPTVNATPVGTQFRWSDFHGDFNFDGVVDCQDRLLIERAACEGWTLDDTEPATTLQGNPTIRYTRQLEDFNAVLMMIRMDLTDGSTGEWTSGQVIVGGEIVAWGGSVTTDDVAAFDGAFPQASADVCLPCIADTDGSGEVDFFDYARVLNLAQAGDETVDYDCSDQVDGADLSVYDAAFIDGCRP